MRIEATADDTCRIQKTLRVNLPPGNCSPIFIPGKFYACVCNDYQLTTSLRIFAYMKRSTYFYALSMAGLLFLLKLVDYKYLVYGLKMEYYVAIIAIFFT